MELDIDIQSAMRIAELFRVLGDPLRIRILSLLLGGEKNVSTIAEALNVRPSSVSHHLRNLRQLRLVEVRREGKWMYYSLDGEELRDILEITISWIDK
jgi:ArsR family transcriptional regulator